MVHRLEAHEAAPPPLLLVAYTNPQKVWFAVFSHSLDQLKYQDAKTAWNRIFQPASHSAPEEGTEGLETKGMEGLETLVTLLQRKGRRG